uniref:hypothetical protein n=1 Tax=Rothia dentocariosa TaxID=2047 RepID=UPI003FA369CB
MQPEFEDDVLPVDEPGDSVSDEAQDKESAEEITAEKALDKSADGSEKSKSSEEAQDDSASHEDSTEGTEDKDAEETPDEQEPVREVYVEKAPVGKISAEELVATGLIPWRTMGQQAESGTSTQAEAEGRTMLFVRPCAETCRPCAPRNSRRASLKSQRNRRSPRASASA